MRYVIVYTNDKIVQGHHIYYLVSKVHTREGSKGSDLPFLCRFQPLTLSPSLSCLKSSISFMWGIVGNSE